MFRWSGFGYVKKDVGGEIRFTSWMERVGMNDPVMRMFGFEGRQAGGLHGYRVGKRCVERVLG